MNQKISAMFLSATLTLLSAGGAQAQGFFDALKNAANNAASSVANKAVNSATTGNGNNAGNDASSNQNSAPAQTPNAPGNSAAAGTPESLSAYQNYDFTPGASIIFADDFTTTQDGEFPDQWDLLAGQAVVNQAQGRAAFLLTDGNYVRVSPRLKSKAYLPAQYTIEMDVYSYSGGGNGLLVGLNKGSDDTGDVSLQGGGAEYVGPSVRLGASPPVGLDTDAAWRGRWHHYAIAVRNDQLKVYIDQYRVLTVPHMNFSADNLVIKAIGDHKSAPTLTNVRVAAGGGMNMLGQKFTDAKIVTYGINFDIDKATLRPESMGTLNQIKRIMTDNADLTFEIGGHTDNTGASAHNLSLSQQRADAVKAQLVTMGIASARLSTKGYGDSKPIASNDSPEGKANNRRVEFVRTSP